MAQHGITENADSVISEYFSLLKFIKILPIFGVAGVGGGWYFFFFFLMCYDKVSCR